MQFNKKSVVITVVAVACVVLFLLLAQNKTYTGQAYGLFSTPKADSVDPLKEKVSAEFIPSKLNTPAIDTPSNPQYPPTYVQGSCGTNGIPIAQIDIDNALQQRGFYDISTPGYYCFTQDVSLSSTNSLRGIISINAKATLDLNGHTFSMSQISDTDVAILINSDNVIVKNGEILNFVRGIDIALMQNGKNVMLTNLEINQAVNAISVWHDLNSLTIQDNAILSRRPLGPLLGMAIRISGDLQNSQISGNVINANGVQNGISISSLSDVLISRNTITNYAISGIRAGNSEGFTIQQNNFLPEGIAGNWNIRGSLEFLGRGVDIFVRENNFEGSAAANKAAIAGIRLIGWQLDVNVLENSFQDYRGAIFVDSSSVVSGTVESNVACNTYYGVEALNSASITSLIQQNNNWNAINC